MVPNEFRTWPGGVILMAILEAPLVVQLDAICDVNNVNFRNMLKQLSYPKTGAFIKVVGHPTRDQLELVERSFPGAFKGEVRGGRTLTAEGSSLHEAFRRHLPTVQSVQSTKELIAIVKTMLEYYGHHIRIFDRYLFNDEITKKKYKFLRELFSMLNDIAPQIAWDIQLWIGLSSKILISRNIDMDYQEYINTARQRFNALVREEFNNGLPQGCFLELHLDRSKTIHSRMVLSKNVGIGLSHSFHAIEGGVVPINNLMEMYLMPGPSLTNYWGQLDELRKKPPLARISYNGSS